MYLANLEKVFVRKYLYNKNGQHNSYIKINGINIDQGYTLIEYFVSEPKYQLRIFTWNNAGVLDKTIVIINVSNKGAKKYITSSILFMIPEDAIKMHKIIFG